MTLTTHALDLDLDLDDYGPDDTAPPQRLWVLACGHVQVADEDEIPPGLYCAIDRDFTTVAIEIPEYPTGA